MVYININNKLFAKGQLSEKRKVGYTLMNEKSKEKKIEISVEDLVAFRDLLSKMDFTNRDCVDITQMSMYDYDRARADALYQDYANFWIKVTTAFYAMCRDAGVPNVYDRKDGSVSLDFNSLLN